MKVFGDNAPVGYHGEVAGGKGCGPVQGGGKPGLGFPRILRNKGGPSGSGSLLTEKGSALLAASEQIEAAARENLEKLYHAYFENLL